ncbi:hypothetical protein B296_00024070 [Ensete ventricosum]|uniref:Glabrous enhancer-binding protein-like DBD domain-containing protein n=1 Tax=Ensete ventricosum TaxID=4639 RepID=A0A427AEK8_ENSVE|nr:hypothetical protein B296_00024070 [Ensete ventricosum]
MAWTQEEEVRLLRAALEIAEEPVESFDPSVSLVGRIRRAVKRSFTDDEILAKVKQLRRSYEEESCCNVIRSGRAVGVGDGAVFEISGRIWGRARDTAATTTTTAAKKKKKMVTSSIVMYYRRRPKKPTMKQHC